MKKIIIGILIGFTLTLPLSTLASSPIGKQVTTTLPFYVDGQKGSVNAVVIEGTSYVPLRTAGTMFGYQVNYSNGQIKLSSTAVSTNTTQTATQSTTNGSDRVYYYIKSTTLNLKGSDNQHLYINKNGNEYISLDVFGNYATWDGINATVSINGHTIIINRNTTDGVDGFLAKSYGTFVFNIASLGLTATINGDTITLN